MIKTSLIVTAASLFGFIALANAEPSFTVDRHFDRATITANNIDFRDGEDRKQLLQAARAEAERLCFDVAPRTLRAQCVEDSLRISAEKASHPVRQALTTALAEGAPRQVAQR